MPHRTNVAVRWPAGGPVGRLYSHYANDDNEGFDPPAAKHRASTRQANRASTAKLQEKQDAACGHEELFGLEDSLDQMARAFLAERPSVQRAALACTNITATKMVTIEKPDSLRLKQPRWISTA